MVKTTSTAYILEELILDADGGENDVNWIIANIVGARLYQGQQIRKKKNNGIDL